MGKKRSTVITPSRVQYAIRNRFNPIRDFTPEKLAAQLDQFHAGELKDAARTWDAMERRCINTGNVAAKRKKSVARLPWQILTHDDDEVKAGSSPEGPQGEGAPEPQKSDAEMQAEFLESFYQNIRVTSVLEQNESGGLRLLIRQMMDAVGKRFAVHEIVWVPPGAMDSRGIPNLSDVPIAEFRFCPLWWFENRTGRLRFLPSEGALDGEEMPPGEWLVSVGEGIMESCSVEFTFKNMAKKDWIAFSEKFGMPGVLGKTTAAKDSPEWEAMESAVGAFGQDWAAVCSANGDTIEIVEVKSGSNNLPYPPLVEYCDRAIAARWRGADLSTISQGKEGVGASLQGDETNLLLEDDAAWISEILNEQVTRYALEWKFGKGVECKAYFKLQGEISTPADEQFRRDVVKAFMTDRTVVDVIANLTDMKKLIGEAGLPVFEEYTEPFLPVTADAGPRVTGETVKDPEGDIVGGDFEESANDEVRSPNGDEAKAGLGNARTTPHVVAYKDRRTFAAATRTAFREVARRLQAIHAMQNEAEQRVAFQDFLNALPALKKMVNSEAAIADQVAALEKQLENGFISGVKARLRK